MIFENNEVVIGKGKQFYVMLRTGPRNAVTPQPIVGSCHTYERRPTKSAVGVSGTNHRYNGLSHLARGDWGLVTALVTFDQQAIEC